MILYLQKNLYLETMVKIDPVLSPQDWQKLVHLEVHSSWYVFVTFIETVACHTNEWTNHGY